MDLNETRTQIKEAGPANVRIVPMEGQSVVTGLHKIEVKKKDCWVSILGNVSKEMAESLVSQAGSRVILG